MKPSQPPPLGEMLALVDALRSGTLNPAQAGIVRSLRYGLALLAELEEDMVDVNLTMSH